MALSLSAYSVASETIGCTYLKEKRRLGNYQQKEHLSECGK